MIAKLRGIIDSVGEDWVILDVNGVGYQVSCSAQTLARLEKPGAPATFHTEMRMRDEVPHLYGFVERAELVRGLIGGIEDNDAGHGGDGTFRRSASALGLGVEVHGVF